MSMEEVPKFIREYSKETNKVGRDSMAAQIKTIRKNAQKEARGFDIPKKENQDKLENTNIELEKKIKELEELKSEVKKIDDSFLPNWIFYFKNRSLAKDAKTGKEEINTLKNQIKRLQEGMVRLEENSKREVLRGQKEANYYLENFYRDAYTKWSWGEFSKEDISRYFNEKYLESLSLEDYEILLRRFPSNMITHVTRQGVRDHVGMWEHSAGEGSFHTGFTDILEDNKRIISPLGVKIKEEEKTKSLSKYIENLLNLDVKKESYIAKRELVEKSGGSELPSIDFFKEKAILSLDKFLKGELGGFNSDEYFDRSAIHFAAEQVADYFYGAESSNEIFFTFPGNFIASQYYFRHPGLVIDNHDLKWNDKWVWEKEEKGISLDAGVVFIPSKTPVNKETGSKYELNENKEPIINQEYIDIANNFVESKYFDDFSERALIVYGNHSKDGKEQLNSLKTELNSKLGKIPEELQEVLTSYHFLNTHEVYKKIRKERGEEDPLHSCNETTVEKLTEFGLQYIKSENTVSSKEYWENYFTKHPGQKPSKIVYYENPDPTSALNEWKKNNYLHRKADYGTTKAYSKEEEGYLGFNENLVDDPTELLSGRSSRFRSLAIKIINEYFENI